MRLTWVLTVGRPTCSRSDISGVGEALRDELQHFALTLGEQIDVSASFLPADDHGD